MLRGGLLAGAAVLVTGAGAACSTGPSDDEQTAAKLVPIAEAATADQAAALTLAPQALAYTNALKVVAEQRGEHALRIREEIARLDQSATSTMTTTTAAGDPTAPADPSTDHSIASVSALQEQLRVSARAAADAGVELSGYPAGLLGSVSASCITLAEVQLA